MMTTAADNNNHNHNHNNKKLNKSKSHKSKSNKSCSSWNIIFIGFLIMTGIVCLLAIITGLIVVPGMHDSKNPHGDIVGNHPAFTTLQERAKQFRINNENNENHRKQFENSYHVADHNNNNGGGGDGSGSGGNNNNDKDKEEETIKKVDSISAANMNLRRPAQTNDSDQGQKYYMLFSTGCTPFQNWQALAFFYFAHKVKQPGTIVRLVSGCTNDEAKELQIIHKERVLPLQLKSKSINQKFEMHITPDFGSGEGNQKYWNKPHGILHWMEESLGFGSTNTASSNNGNNGDTTIEDHIDDNSIIIILDPDMMLLRPITSDFNSNTNYVGGWVDTKNTKQHQKYGHTSPVDYNNNIVKHGAPHAQKYGFGNGWLTSLKGHLEDIVGPNSPALNVSLDDAADYYPAGPPYVATGRDMYQLSKHWVQFLPGVYKLFPQFMAEMHGYSIAAAHLGLPHKLAEGFMVSDVDAGGENYDFIDNKLNKTNVCMKPPNIITQNSGNNNNVELDESYTSVNITLKEIPFVVHYCQRYALGRWFFSKYKLREDMFNNCSAPLMKEPPSNVADIYDWYIFPNGIETMDFSIKDKIKNLSPSDSSYYKVDAKRKEHLRNGWMLCSVIYGINEAIQVYKEEKCIASIDIHPEYYKKTYHFHDDKNFTSSITDPSNPFIKK